jgi:hypothetical protein
MVERLTNMCFIRSVVQVDRLSMTRRAQTYESAAIENRSGPGGAWRFGDESGPGVGVTFFAGTFVRHPLALAAARAVLERLRQEGPEMQR